MRLAAAAASPSRPSAITACARTRGEGSASAATNRRGLDAVELRLAVGQRPERELADGGVAGELPQDAVRPGAVELLEREKGRDPPVQGLGRIGRQVGEGAGRLRRPPATDDLALEMEPRGRIGAAQPVDRAAASSAPSGRDGRSPSSPGGATHARNPTCGPT